MSVTYINGIGGDNSSLSTTLALAATNHTTGNTIIVRTSNYYGALGYRLVSGVSDTAGNTYSSAGTVGGGDPANGLECWVATNITGNASNVVTVTWESATTYRVAIADQYSGLATSGVYDAGSTYTITSTGTTHVTSNVTTLNADDLLHGSFIEWDGGATSLSSSGTSTLRTSLAGSYATVDRIVTSTGSYSTQVASNASDRYVCATRAFKAATVAAQAKRMSLLGVG